MKEGERSLDDTLNAAVKLFRLGMEGQASENLVGFIDALMAKLATYPPDRMNRFAPLLGEIVSAQQRKDYLRVADLLEYEVSFLLHGD